MHWNKLGSVYVLSLFTLVISPSLILSSMIQSFTNDNSFDLEDFKHSTPQASSVDSELVMVWNKTYGELKDEVVKSLIRLPNGN